MKTLILNKTLKILEVLSSSERAVSLKEICERTGITPPAASRLLSDLTESGYIRKVTYRTFEPGLGMAALGQGAMRHDFFPRRAIDFLDSELKKEDLQGALAGMFHGRLVYLYHSYALAPRMAMLSEEHPLSVSNIALVILSCRHGRKEAEKMMLGNLSETDHDPEIREKKAAIIRKCLREFEKNHFSVWENERGGRNICFPVASGAQIYGLSFLIGKDEKRDPSEIFLTCSGLVTSMRKMLEGVQSSR